ncbi:translation initiation factor IF-2 [Myotis daubentonii]|uniref:translation initiation factor IF-2 n=1 Tax=Myotis daubentonii TaxID=98922 RepID=UPI002872B3C5|nr:translation initiation factor IF-2 [Myotis daubentonii]
MSPSCPRDGDRPLTALETSSAVLPMPPSLPSPAPSPRTRCRHLGPQPLRPRSGRLGRGSDSDRGRMRTATGSGLEGSDENKSRDTVKAETGQGRSSGPSPLPTSPAPQPAAPGPGPAHLLGEARAAPRGTHLIRRTGRAWRGTTPRLPGAAAPSAVRTAAGPPPPEPGRDAACAPATRRTLSSKAAGGAQRAGARRSRELSAASGALPARHRPRLFMQSGSRPGHRQQSCGPRHGSFAGACESDGLAAEMVFVSFHSGRKKPETSKKKKKEKKKDGDGGWASAPSGRHVVEVWPKCSGQKTFLPIPPPFL